MNRNLSALADQAFDLLILGGGITGAGVALDAASRGWKVALIDQGDFASATSSASSKLIHGGLRYLEQGQLRLVYEALHERQWLLHSAPHLVQPLRFVMPFYHGSRLPAWKGRLGVCLYDLLAGRNNLQRSRPMNRNQLRRWFPALKADQLHTATIYFDAQMDDARLCIEVIQAASRYGATVANYVQAIGFEVMQNRIAAVQVRDRIQNQTFSIRCRLVLNATGPWVDAICQLAGASPTQQHLQPTKGVHILVAGLPYLRDSSSQEVAGFTLFHPRDGRVFFVLPWQKQTLIGTTDTFADEPADPLGVTQEEEAYLLEGYNHYFTPALTSEAIRGRFAGLRPLLRSDPKKPSDRSREFRIFPGPNGMLCVAGGKWTTYRHMAEVIVNHIADMWNQRRSCITKSIPLYGPISGNWNDFRLAAIRKWEKELGPLAQHLVDRYGSQIDEVATVVLQSDPNRQPIVVGEPDVIGEWEYQKKYEMALFPEDHLLRRSRIGLWHPELWKNPRPHPNV